MTNQWSELQRLLVGTATNYENCVEEWMKEGWWTRIAGLGHNLITKQEEPSLWRYWLRYWYNGKIFPWETTLVTSFVSSKEKRCKAWQMITALTKVERECWVLIMNQNFYRQNYYRDVDICEKVNICAMFWHLQFHWPFSTGIQVTLNAPDPMSISQDIYAQFQ